MFCLLVSLCTTRLQCLQRPEEHTGPSRTGVTDGCGCRVGAVWMPGTECWSSAKSTNVLSHRALSPAPCTGLFDGSGELGDGDLYLRWGSSCYYPSSWRENRREIQEAIKREAGVQNLADPEQHFFEEARGRMERSNELPFGG